MSSDCDQLVSESLVTRSLRFFRASYFPNRPRAVRDAGPGLLDTLPVDVQFYIMTFLSPEDLVSLGSASRYWSQMVRDPSLWRHFLLRDMPTWTSIDHVTMPQVELLETPLINKDQSLEDREDGDDREMRYDYMTEYLKASPSCRKRSPRPAYQVVTSFLQSLVPWSEPRYAMFGPGMEQLDVSLVTRLMHAPDVLPVSGTPHRHSNVPGIGSGISFMFNNHHRFNILTLYSTNRAERDRARLQQHSVSNKLFTLHGTDQSGAPVVVPSPQVQQVCQAVDGFIYVANAEPGGGDVDSEAAQIQAVLSSAEGPASKPLLVLSCVSREEVGTGTRSRTSCRTLCVHMAKRLRLPQLENPWMVQDTVVQSLSGLLDGVSWLLRRSGLPAC